MRRKTTKEELIKDIADVLVQCDWPTLRMMWDVVGTVAYTREKFGITFDSFSYNTPIKSTHDEKTGILTLQMLASKKCRQNTNNPKTA